MDATRAAVLKPHLDRLLEDARLSARVSFDPVEIPWKYQAPRDVEVAALLSASLAYGRVALFKPKVEGLLAAMGRSPASFVTELDVRGATRLLTGFVYRFNVGTDLAVLLLGMGAALREYGSLEALFLRGRRERESYRSALGSFTEALRSVSMVSLRKALGPERGLDHLLPRLQADGTGAAKRLNLFMRWMVRGPDPVDFGIWKGVSPRELHIPLDTHIARLSRLLGLTQRKDMGWKTVEEITASLRLLHPEDPIRYDFALCHYGMSGLCPSSPSIDHCRKCALASPCRLGRRRARLSAHG